MVLLYLAAPVGAQALNPDEAAMQVLNSARKAYNEKNYLFAAGRFREFIQQYPQHKDLLAARYGLALALIEGDPKDYPAAVAELTQVVAREDFPDRPFAFYYLGAAQRGIGYQALEQAEAKPNEAPNWRAQAKQNFENAAKNFAIAAAALAARVDVAKEPARPAGGGKTGEPEPARPSPDISWLARSLCDQCEMILRLERFKEAAELANSFLANPNVSKSRYRGLVLYYLGYAAFTQKDYAAAAKALSQLAPFRQEFGVHARYMMARTHHLSGERPEAETQYKALLAGYDEQKKAAQEALKNPNTLAPDQKAFFERLVNGPPPEYIVRAMFYLALLQAEGGKFADALNGFTTIVQQYPKSPVVPEAQLRQGYCQMQLKNYAEAIKLLQPLCDNPEFGDQALWWLGRSQVGMADPQNPQAYDQVLRTALDTLRRAVDRAGQMAGNDPEARLRRADIMMELADTQQLARMYREAAQTYQQVLAENANPDRAEEALQRQITSLHLAGAYRESDDACQRFEVTYPKSTLLPAVLFRSAENAYMTAIAAANNPNLPNREQELAKLFGEAINRYRRLLKQFPDFAYVQLARQAMATCSYRLGKYEDAIPLLGEIPEADRTGELATVPYLLADCLLRTLPSEAEDAVTAARLVDRAEQAAKLLEQFLAAQPKSPQAPDALLKLSCCYQQMGSMLAEPAERQAVLTKAKDACDRSQQQFPQDPSLPAVVFEKGKCLALLGDSNGALAELGRFRVDPLRNSAVAPLALVRLSALLRYQNKPTDAAAVMAECRTVHEANLLRDPNRSDWIPTIQYEHAMALRESGKLAEARALFESLAAQFPSRPEGANAVWRAAQCRREELVAAMAAARTLLAKPGARPEELGPARTAIDQSVNGLVKAIEPLEAQVRELAKNAPDSEACLRARYETAWCYRALADAEIAATRERLQKEALDKLQAKLAREAPGVQLPPPRIAEVPLSAIPIQPSETAALNEYRLLIAAAPEKTLAVQARIESAEMLSERANYEPALQLLAEAMEKNPPLELVERIRLRLAVILLATNDPKTALTHLDAVIRNPASPFLAEARYLMGEAYIQQKDWPKAIEQLLALRDQQPLQNVQGVSDRALLRLAYAYGQAGQWAPACQTLDTLLQRFPQTPWFEQARYDQGWAWQMLKQLDNAINCYTEVTRRTASDLAAKAQLQIGLCRLEQRNFPEAARNLLIVPFTYDCPDLNPQAFCEAARAYKEMNQPAEAQKLWERVVKDYPTTPWAKTSAQALAGNQ